MTIKFKKLDPAAVLPERKHPGDAGMDIRTIDEGIILPHNYAKFRSGIAAVLPDGYELQVRPRSGLSAKNGVVASFGTIDAGYRGDIGIILYNHGDEPYRVFRGDRVAQLVLAPVISAEIEETDTLDDTDRGTGGFGSTGVN